MSSRSVPRPKRAGDDFARFHTHDDSEPSSKKPRFDARNPSTLAPDAPEEDAILELDEIGKGGQATKRSAVNIDGYDSDSSTDNFDARADQKAKAAKNETKTQDEEENDMFADLEEEFKDGDEDEDLAKEGKGKKKAVRFLDADEIEGQVSSSKSGGHVAADFTLNGKAKARDQEVEESSESGGEEERDRVGSDVDEELGAGAKKKHAPKLDAFNMKQEGEEGRFDESGNYVRKAADPDAVHDSWLEGLSKKDIKKAREAQEKRDEERRRKDVEQDSLLTSDILNTLISRLEKGETVLEALQRLGKGKSKPKPKWQKNKRKNNGDAMDVDAEKEAEDPNEVKRKEEVETITGAADQLLTRGQTEIYDAERELLMRQYRSETGEDWAEPAHAGHENGTAAAAADDIKQWEYRWSDARDGGEHHGPYDGHTMSAWNDAGYFGEGVEFRQIGDDEWSRSVDFV
ncbi:hypothetical protein NA57DRAFT_59888 [Rhizodiscina lignyota]|uniref:GYF domain-containing protein n=1 Tax=Rhizodiscina lignyota TaxID=1504668 RepID=A0A9P4I735_9PEZI|nr:hypothetical protein NA57DRAFT_59888 [Rhizodiscina lignyota]